MYQDIIDGLVLPFGAEDVQGFSLRTIPFYIQQKLVKYLRLLTWWKILRKSEFLCKFAR